MIAVIGIMEEVHGLVRWCGLVVVEGDMSKEKTDDRLGKTAQWPNHGIMIRPSYTDS